MEKFKLEEKVHVNDFTHSFDATLYFVRRFNELPHVHSISNNGVEVFDLTKISDYIDKCKDVKIVKHYTQEKIGNEVIESQYDDSVGQDGVLYDSSSYPSLVFINITENFIMEIDKNSITTWYMGVFIREGLLKYVNEIKNMRLTPKFKSKVHLITHDGRNYNLEAVKTSSTTPIDFNKHYNDNFIAINENIENFINDEGKSGLVILHGIPGSGKTNYIRHLTQNFNNKFIILNNSLMNHISEPSFLSFILTQKGSILILEDCEQLLMEREKNTFNNGISSILNLTDGIFSDILNIKIIATFNTDLKNIDKALLRNGRLIEKYDFRELSLNKTNSILDELGLKLSNKPLTLANIYNFNEERAEAVDNKIKRIGF